MLTNCVICNKQIDLKSIQKIINLIPKVCSISCLKSFCRLIGAGSLQNIFDIAHSNGLVIQINNEKNPFRSKIEQTVANLFDSENIKWEYEKYIFYGKRFISYKYQPIENRCYIPDFFLPEYNVFVEVKYEEANQKPTKFASLLPLIVIDYNFLKEIKHG